MAVVAVPSVRVDVDEATRLLDDIVDRLHQLRAESKQGRDPRIDLDEYRELQERASGLFSQYE